MQIFFWDQIGLFKGILAQTAIYSNKTSASFIDFTIAHLPTRIQLLYIFNTSYFKTDRLAN